MKTVGRITFWLSASAVMLTLMQVPFGVGFLGWVCLVPFLLVCQFEEKAWLVAAISFIVSSVYWLCNLWWLSLVTVPGYIAFCLYLGLYWPVLVFCVRHLKRSRLWGKVPFFLSIAILFVGAETIQGLLITGFSWRLLAHSQYANTALIQISDVCGAAGVSFIIAMVNGLLAELVTAWKNGKLIRAGNFVKAACVGATLASVLVYGSWRIAQADDVLEAGPVIGSVQPNIPSHIKELSENAEMIMQDLLEKSESCIQAGCALVVWPETIVLETMNHQYLRFQEPNSLPIKFDRMISEHALSRAYVLFGAHAAGFKREGDYYVVSDRYNSAFMYTPDGLQETSRYDKIHLVPFGEYIPFRESAPFVYRFFRFFSPYDYDYSLTRGTEYTVFTVKEDGRQWRFGVLICYEDTDAYTARRMVVENGKKKVDWLVNISNDGWYVRYDEKNGRVIPSGELSQRTAISVFRAVENRVSIVRSVNTGISCIIDPIGRMREGFIAGDLPSSVMDREAVAGWFVDRVLVDKRVTVFSRCGKWMDYSSLALALLVVWGSLWHGLFKKTAKNERKLR